MKRKQFLVGAAAAGAASVVPMSGAANAHGNGHGHGRPRKVELQLLAVNDFHGNIEASDGLTYPVDGVDTPAGGAEYLATHLAQARDGERYSLTVAAGDLIGGTPFLSGVFGDEPSIESLNAMGIDVSSVGNHEFDKGIDALQRHIEGDGDYKGAAFAYLGANVVDEASGQPVLEPYWIKDFGCGVKIGFIGMTLEGTEDIVAKSGIVGLDFLDEIETANKYAEKLYRKGVKAIVALIHEGGYPVEDGSGGVSGPIVAIAEGISSKVDILVTGHTHQEYSTVINDPSGNPRLVTSAASYGRVFTEIRAEFNTRSGKIKRTSVVGSNKVVERNVDPDPAQTDLIAFYNSQVEDEAARTVGYISEDITRGATRAEEFPLGSLIADAQLARTADPVYGTAEIAFMNPGGVRADLHYGDDGLVSYREVWAVQPFGNYLVSMDLSGAQILELLQQQLPTGSRVTTLFLQVSEGFTYTWDSSLAGTDQIVADSLALNGEPIVADQVYRVTVNSFLSDGGDSFAVLIDGQNKFYGEVDLDAFEAYLTENSSSGAPIGAPELGRVTVI